MTSAELTRPDVATVGDAPQVFDPMGRGVAPCLPFLRRILKHPRVMHYNRLVALVMAVNLGWAVYGGAAANWWTSEGAHLDTLALVAQANLAVAV
ncbi:MAG: hypothetical protein QOD39_4498, partial [Mycobacterium sp.]|nr:hypothetical protein [Mycobacterium sp.]